MKTKESETVNKFLDLARELTKLWNINVTVIPLVVCALGTFPKGLVKKLEEFDIRKIEAI